MTARALVLQAKNDAKIKKDLKKAAEARRTSAFVSDQHAEFQQRIAEVQFSVKRQRRDRPALSGRGRRKKGATGEVQVSKLVSAWWCRAEPEVRFKRTPKSGGWATATQRGGFKVSGDICSTSEIWPFTVEIKRHEAWSFATFSLGRKSPVWAWWRQAINAAAEENRIPMLFFRHSNQPWLVLLPETTLAPVLASFGIEPEVRFGKLSPGVDDGDIRPLCLLAAKLFVLPPGAFLPRRRRDAKP
jgi:hypothetical protein